jgi:peptidoglycan/LPS O-acetylase OafA/YrhL
MRGWGASGVDLFFVISGFVMVLTVRTNPRSIGEFVAGRLFRIVPIYWLLTLLMVALWSVAPGIFRGAGLQVPHVFASLFFVSTGLLEKTPVVYVGWTLEFEMLFYAIFAVTLPLATRRGGWVLPAVILISLALMGVTSAIVVEFALGMACAEAYLRGWMRVAAWPCLVVGVLALLCVLPLGEVENRLVWWGLPALLIVFGAVSVRQYSGVFLRVLGDASYSIYLIQVIAISAFYKVAAANYGAMNREILAVAACFFAALLGCAFYFAVEAPIARRLRLLTRPAERAMSAAI